ncbi:hypothetical protein FRC17_000353 [Serendipita sp. 399]|nr:hypothetical protein FRC17_000353 [Serendipita sp. 399]
MSTRREMVHGPGRPTALRTFSLGTSTPQYRGKLPLSPPETERSALTRNVDYESPETEKAKEDIHPRNLRRAPSIQYNHNGAVGGRPQPQRTSRWLIVVTPPTTLNTQPVLGHTLAMGPPGRYQSGILMPLFPTMYGQLAAIAREFSLPSIAGVCLYLHVQEPNIGINPRISDEAWQLLWSPYFTAAEEAALPMPSGPPICGRIEFDVDTRKARWYESWVNGQERPVVLEASIPPSVAQTMRGWYQDHREATQGDTETSLDQLSTSRKSKHVPRPLALSGNYENLSRPPQKHRAVVSHDNDGADLVASKLASRRLSPVTQATETTSTKQRDLDVLVRNWRATTPHAIVNPATAFGLATSSSIQVPNSAGYPYFNLYPPVYPFVTPYPSRQDVPIEPLSKQPPPSSTQSVSLVPCYPEFDLYPAGYPSLIIYPPVKLAVAAKEPKDDSVAPVQSLRLASAYPILNIYPTVYPFLEIYPSFEAPRTPKEERQEPKMNLRLGSYYPELVIYPPVYPTLDIYPSFKGVEEKKVAKLEPIVTLLPSVYPNLTIYPPTYPCLEIYPTMQTRPRQANRQPPHSPSLDKRLPSFYPFLEIYAPQYPHLQIYPITKGPLSLASAEWRPADLASSTPTSVASVRLEARYPAFNLYPPQYPYFDIYPSVPSTRAEPTTIHQRQALSISIRISESVALVSPPMSPLSPRQRGRRGSNQWTANGFISPATRLRRGSINKFDKCEVPALTPSRKVIVRPILRHRKSHTDLYNEVKDQVIALVEAKVNATRREIASSPVVAPAHTTIRKLSSARMDGVASSLSRSKSLTTAGPPVPALPTRQRVDSETTSNILQYYTSNDEPEAVSAADLAHIHSRATKRPATEPASRQERSKDLPTGPTSSSSTSNDLKYSSSIRLVPSTSSTSSSGEAFRRPALHHADSVHIVADNRRIAIVEREGAAQGSNTGFRVSTKSNGAPSGRSVESSQLTLVAPPDADIASYTSQTPSFSAADTVLSKSTKAQNVSHPTAPHHSKRLPEINHQQFNEPAHLRTSSEATARQITQEHSTHSARTAHNVGNSPASPRRSEEDSAIHRIKHRKQDSNGSAGPVDSKHTEDQEGSSLLSPSRLSPDHTPAKRLFTRNKGENHANDGFHIALPDRPRHFGSSPNILTPNIGDSKPIDRKVAAPYVVDIHSDLADLWLAATPDKDTDALPTAVGSPITASMTTDSNSQSNSLSPSSSRQSPASPVYSTGRYEPVNDSMTSSMPSPPRRIDIHALSITSSPVCPPRPQRQPSPSKPSSRRNSGEGFRTNNSVNLNHEVPVKSDATSSTHCEPIPKHSDSDDPKYALASVSDDESASEYSGSLHDRKGNPSSSRKGSIHLREGAFPSHSVFLHRLQTEVTSEPSEADLKTPTGREKEPTILQFFNVDGGHRNRSVESHSDTHSVKLDQHSIRLHRSPSNASSQRRSEEISQSRRPSVSVSNDEEHGISTRPSSLRPKVPMKDQLTESIDGHSPPSTNHQDSSVLKNRVQLQSQIGHGPPPSDRARNVNAPSSFKAKGPLVTSGTLHSKISRKIPRKPPSMWPSAMSFADVLAEQTPLARARGYAMKINELATEDCGLRDWIESVINRTTKSPTSSTSKLGPAGFLATLSRKTSMRTRGTQSATESREKEAKAPPRKLVSSRSLAARSNGSGGGTPPSTTPATTPAPLPPVAPTLPGGPRPPRPKRASTMIISAPKPIISAPIPITPLSANPATSTFSHNSEYPDSSPSMVAQPLSISKEPPKAPEGPRAPGPRLARTPSFPGHVRVSSSGNLRSTASFKPAPTPLSTTMTGQSNTSGASNTRERPSLEEANLNMLCDVMPHVPRETLALYLRKANGQNLVAIGRYLEDERTGAVARI